MFCTLSQPHCRCNTLQDVLVFLTTRLSFFAASLLAPVSTLSLGSERQMVALLIVACLGARYARVSTQVSAMLYYRQQKERETDKRGAKQEDGERGAGNLGAGEYGRQSCAWHRGP